MDVSIIIVTYNTASITKQCIDSVIDKTKDVSYEIILVDNASIDNTKELFSKYDRIKYIESRENVGFGRANNIGIGLAQGNYVFLLNSDTILLNNTVKRFYDIMESLPANVACVGTILLDCNQEPAFSYGDFLYITNLLHKFQNKCINLENNFEVPVVLGADMFVRKSVFDNVGLFDPAFFMYHEENDLQRRFVVNGYKNMIVSGPKIIHLEGQSSNSNVNLLKIKSTFIYIKKWNRKYYYSAYRILYILTRIHKVMFIETSEKKMDYIKLLFSKV